MPDIPITEKRLNEAAQLIINQLPDHAGQLIEELSKQNYTELWQMTAGIILSVHMEGRLSSFILDPAWRDGVKQKDHTCKYEECKKIFKPIHIGQLYCSNECGLRADNQIFEDEKVGILKHAPSEPKSDSPKLDNTDAGWGSPTIDPSKVSSVLGISNAQSEGTVIQTNT